MFEETVAKLADATARIATQLEATAFMRNAADVRLVFKWGNEQDPQFIDVSVVNFGPATADVEWFGCAFLEKLDDAVPDYTSRELHTSMPMASRSNGVQHAFTVAPDPVKTLFTGVLRWTDLNGTVERTFCVEVRRQPGRNEFHFTTVGGEMHNTCRRV